MKKHLNLITKLEHTKLENLVNKLEIYYDPSDSETLIDEDSEFIQEYNLFNTMIRECAMVAFQVQMKNKRKQNGSFEWK